MGIFFYNNIEFLKLYYFYIFIVVNKKIELYINNCK